MYGTDKLKQIIDTGLGLAATLRNIFADGKFQLQEIFLLIGNFTAVTAVIQSWPEAAQQLKELDAKERAELNAYFAAKFDIPNDKVEQFIEKSLTFVVSGVELYHDFTALKKPPTV